MKHRYPYFTPCAFHLFILSFFSFIFFSCGAPDGQFRLEGRFKNLNQGEFYLFNFEQGTLDTIGVKDGRFAYVSYLRDTVTYTLLFPNFSEVPIFARPGAKISINGDVSHLKETEIKGTKENELMTAFRLKTADMTPPEVTAEAERFIAEHTASPVSAYLLRRYILLSATPNYERASALCDTLLNSQPANIPLVRLGRQLKAMRHYRADGNVPQFKAVSTRGDTITNRKLTSQVNVIYLWASWSYDTQMALRQLRQLMKDHRGQLSVLSISVDATPAEGRITLERDSIGWPNVCDGKMWQSPIVGQLGMGTIGDNIIFDSKGKILARNLSTQELRPKVESLLK